MDQRRFRHNGYDYWGVISCPGRRFACPGYLANDGTTLIAQLNSYGVQVSLPEWLADQMV